MLEPGAHLGAYTFVRPIGAGGMGVVYLARHRHIGRDAAIKVLLPELTKNDDIVARFLTEARATAAIRHPGIVEILDCDIDSTGRAYIVMEYLRGESLANCLARARRSLSALPTVVSIGSQVASALSAAHERGIVHRDLKPDNLFLATDGSARSPVVIKILDFGIAKLVSSNGGDTHKTRTGSMLGTPAYMSPEQARDASSIDDRADIYALGCILFEMVAGRAPFVRPGAGEVMIAHVIEPPPRLSSLVQDVDPPLESLVGQMLEKDPAARPQTMSEVQSRLESMVSGRPAPIMTAIMPSVDASQPHIVISTPPPSSGSHPSGPGLFSGGTARFPDAAAPAPVPESTSPSGRMVPGGTLVMPAAGPTTTTHSTTMSGSATEVSSGATKTLSSRRRPAVLGAAIAGVGLVVVVVAMLMKPSAPAGSGGTTTTAIAPLPAPTATNPPVAAVENPTPTETAPKGEPTKETPREAPEPKIDVPARPVVVEVSSDPSDAEVWLPSDSEARGHTPFKVALDPNAGPTHAVLKARGYADMRIDIDPRKPEPMSVKLERLARDHDHDHATSKHKTTELGETKPNKGETKPSKGETKPNKDGYRMMGD
jgi:serine/threonine-protein kinase